MPSYVPEHAAVWFEIPVTDMERSKAFYNAVLHNELTNQDGFPTDPEDTEQYFMQEVARGEAASTDGSDPVDAALCFYKALKVYPTPR